MDKAISEIVGRADSIGGGGDVTLYRALRQIICAPCGGMIEEGALFTRKAPRGQALVIHPQCQECAPFQARDDAVGGLNRSPMLEALLRSSAAGNAPAPKAAREVTAEAVAARLGPALRRAHKTRR